jgi:hypothetical protein
MPIICFEGASAIGKTTTANIFKANDDAFVVPEVNELFGRPKIENSDWYLERQVERWSIALEQSKTHSLVILDGDPFQPLWYNWVYQDESLQTLDVLEQFYKSKVQHGAVNFPDLYFIFVANETELRKRKSDDISRQRHNFEKHLELIEPQRRYFQAMETFSPNRVTFLMAASLRDNVDFIREKLPTFSSDTANSSATLLNDLARWLKQNQLL